MAFGITILGRADVLDGVAEMLDEVQVEGTFPDGTKLVTVHHAIALEQGDLALALYGSFLPPPSAERRGQTGRPAVAGDGAPGARFVQPGELELNVGRTAVQIVVANRGDRPIQVGSHYHFSETNPALAFDRRAAYGKRLDIPAGTAVRF